MHRSIRIAALALPLVLALAWGAGAANTSVLMDPDAPAPVPWAPFVQAEAEPEGPAAPVPWPPFEQDDGTNPDPDLSEGQHVPDGDVEPEPQPEPGTVDEAAPAADPRTVTPGTAKLTLRWRRRAPAVFAGWTRRSWSGCSPSVACSPALPSPPGSCPRALAPPGRTAQLTRHEAPAELTLRPGLRRAERYFFVSYG